MMTPEEFETRFLNMDVICQTRAEMIVAYRALWERAQAANNAALRAQVGAYTPTVPGLQAEDYKTITQLVNEIRQIVATGRFPKGRRSDAVVVLWFVEWAEALKGIVLFRRTEPAEGPNSPENASNDVAWRLAEHAETQRLAQAQAGECARCAGKGGLPSDECGVTVADPWEPAEHVRRRRERDHSARYGVTP